MFFYRKNNIQTAPASGRPREVSIARYGAAGGGCPDGIFGLWGGDSGGEFVFGFLLRNTKVA